MSLKVFNSWCIDLTAGLGDGWEQHVVVYTLPPGASHHWLHHQLSAPQRVHWIPEHSLGIIIKGKWVRALEDAEPVDAEAVRARTRLGRSQGNRLKHRREGGRERGRGREEGEKGEKRERERERESWIFNAQKKKKKVNVLAVIQLIKSVIVRLTLQLGNFCTGSYNSSAWQWHKTLTA